MIFLYFIGAVILLAFAARNVKLALEGDSKIESWIGVIVCLAISFGLFIAGFSNTSSDYNNDEYNNEFNPQYPWESDLEQYRENKKPWE